MFTYVQVYIDETQNGDTMHEKTFDGKYAADNAYDWIAANYPNRWRVSENVDTHYGELYITVWAVRPVFN